MVMTVVIRNVCTQKERREGGKTRSTPDQPENSEDHEYLNTSRERLEGDRSFPQTYKKLQQEDAVIMEGLQCLPSVDVSNVCLLPKALLPFELGGTRSWTSDEQIERRSSHVIETPSGEVYSVILFISSCQAPTAH